MFEAIPYDAINTVALCVSASAAAVTAFYFVKRKDKS